VQKLLDDLHVAQEKITLLVSRDEIDQAVATLKAQHARELEEAVAEAKAQASSQLPAAECPADIQESLAALEAQLKETHRKELEGLKSAHEQTLKKAAEETSAPLAKAEQDIASLRNEIDSLTKAKDEAHAQGIEQGRQEINMKLKLKDSQMQKTNKKLQEVEQALAAVTSNSAASQPSVSGAAIAEQSASAPTPAKQPGANPSTTPLGIGRGRGGGHRGGAASRGRGGTQLAAAVAAASSAAATSAAPTTSFLGAAGKRARENESDNEKDTLAKRIKPAGGPVSINRNRPLPSDPGS
jgi:nucleoprotein TPR